MKDVICLRVGNRAIALRINPRTGDVERLTKDELEALRVA